MAETEGKWFSEMSEAEQKAFMERWRRELPELKRQFEEARAGLRRYAYGGSRRRIPARRA